MMRIEWQHETHPRNARPQRSRFKFGQHLATFSFHIYAGNQGRQHWSKFQFAWHLPLLNQGKGSICVGFGQHLPCWKRWGKRAANGNNLFVAIWNILGPAVSRSWAQLPKNEAIQQKYCRIWASSTPVVCWKGKKCARKQKRKKERKIKPALNTGPGKRKV